MKLSSIVCVSFVALAAMAMSADGAFAMTQAEAVALLKACTAKGGTVTKNRDGTTDCVIPGGATPTSQGSGARTVVYGGNVETGDSQKNGTTAPARAGKFPVTGTSGKTQGCTKDRGSSTRGTGSETEVRPASGGLLADKTSNVHPCDNGKGNAKSD